MQYVDPSKKYIPRRYKSSAGYLIIGKVNGVFTTSAITLFFRNIEVHSAGCADTNNIFQLDGSDTTVETILSAHGGQKSSCMYTVLNYPSTTLHISKLTGGDSDTVFIGGTDKNSPLFSFNQNTASQWNSVNLWGLYNSFIVPKGNRVAVGIINKKCEFLFR